MTPVLITAMLAGAAAMTAPTAMAADDHVPSATVERASWGYIDEATPNRGHLDPPGDAPIGTWRTQGHSVADAADAADAEGTDGGHNRRHTARSYFTYDTARFAGARIISATLTTTETHAADCRKRAVQLWQTGPFDARSSWSRPPAERHLLAARGVPAGSCLAVGEQFDVTAALARSVAAGKALTLGLRVSSGREDQAEFARRFANNPTLTVVYNTPPPTPVDVVLASDQNVPCPTAAPGYFTVGYEDLVMQFPEDADGPQDTTTARLAIWPTHDPAARTELTEALFPFTRTARFELGPFLGPDHNGTTFAMQLRAEDGTDVSAWTATCFVTVDTVAPDVRPTVTSTDYPSSGGPAGDVGRPGTFTFGANGVADVAGYRYNLGAQSGYVAAETLGGPASVVLAPTRGGPQSLSVVSVDRVGRGSPTTFYSFVVRDSRPFIGSTTYQEHQPSGGIGVPGEFVFRSSVPVIEFEYRIDDGPASTVAALPDRSAFITFTPERGGLHTLTARGRDANGYGMPREYRFTVSTAPFVELDLDAIVGEATTVTLRPGLPGVVEYEYWFDNAPDDGVTVPAGPDGSATFDWVPSWPTPGSISVLSRTADGTPSDSRHSSVNVDEATPFVSYVGGTRPGEPATITATSNMPQATEFQYWLEEDRSDLRTVPAQPDGTAVFEWTPLEDGYHLVMVQATNATGALTGIGATYIYTDSTPGVSSSDYPEWNSAGGVGVPGTFTFTPRQTDVVEYVYTLGTWSDPGPEVTVPAAADGTATVVITPTMSGYQELDVRSRNAAGQLSQIRRYPFIVG